MANLKTIQELQEKRWYRLWRVIFLLFYFLALLFAVVSAFDTQSMKQFVQFQKLGQEIKAKYPGAYGDLSDVEVGQRVKAKYPGSYNDFMATPKAGGGYTLDQLLKMGATPVEAPTPEPVIGAGGWLTIILYSILYILIVNVIFEIIRSAFNYIFAGKYFPPAWFTIINKM